MSQASLAELVPHGEEGVRHKLDEVWRSVEEGEEREGEVRGRKVGRCVTV